jgi:hypothetical protein
MTTALKALANHYKKADTKQRKKSKKTVEQRVEELSWPAEGFKTLQDCLNPCIEELLALCNTDSDDPNDDDNAIIRSASEYLYFIQVLVCSFFAFAPSGRVCGIKNLRLKHGYDLVERSK